MADILAFQEKAAAEELTEEATRDSGLVDIDHERERKLLRKLDLHIMPLVMGLYLFVRPFLLYIVRLLFVAIIATHEER